MSAILRFFGSIIGFFDKITGNYMLAIALFALVVQIILLPLAIKQQKNQIKQAKLAPKVMAIRKKYSGRHDQKTQQQMQQETMELYNKEGYNQFGGCLPLLIQLPIIIVLYQVIIKPLSYVVGLSSETVEALFQKLQGLGYYAEQEFSKVAEIDIIGKIQTVLQSDANAFSDITEFSADSLPNFTLGSFNLTLSPKEAMTGADGWQWSWLIIIPILTFVGMYFSMKITRKFSYQPPEAQDAQNSASMKIMNFASPLISTYIAFIWRAAVGIYWFIRNVYQVIQQIIIAKAMPLPKFTDEEYKAAERELKGSNQNNKKVVKSENAGKVRSLHHIDDDDADETEFVSPAKEAKPNNAIGAAPLKDDNDDTDDVKKD